MQSYRDAANRKTLADSGMARRDQRVNNVVANRLYRHSGRKAAVEIWVRNDFAGGWATEAGFPARCRISESGGQRLPLARA
jgi:hypothetical protein